jgi:hypothetical protein
LRWDGLAALNADDPFVCVFCEPVEQIHNVSTLGEFVYLSADSARSPADNAPLLPDAAPACVLGISRAEARARIVAPG